MITTGRMAFIDLHSWQKDQAQISDGNSDDSKVKVKLDDRIWERN